MPSRARRPAGRRRPALRHHRPRTAARGPRREAGALIHSKDDEADLVRIRDHLSGTHGYPVSSIHIDSFVSLLPEGGGARWHGGCVYGGDVERGSVIHRPDVCVVSAGRPALIVELDGSYHDRGPGLRKTERRNSHYREAGVPFVVINKADLKYLKEDWRDYLDSELARIGRSAGGAGDAGRA